MEYHNHYSDVDEDDGPSSDQENERTSIRQRPPSAKQRARLPQRAQSLPDWKASAAKASAKLQSILKAVDRVGHLIVDKDQRDSIKDTTNELHKKPISQRKKKAVTILPLSLGKTEEVLACSSHSRHCLPPPLLLLNQMVVTLAKDAQEFKLRRRRRRRRE